MRYVALAVDYDGVVARDGHIDAPTHEALVRLRGGGRRLVLVTGRELADLRALDAPLLLFDRVIAENGGVLFDPQCNEERALAAPPPESLVEALRARGVAPLSVGRVVVATFQPHGAAVLDAIHALGLEHQIIFNKGAIMVLPPGINKATGLVAALDELALSPHNLVAIGDAENDRAMLDLAECSVAVANALPSVKAGADLLTAGGHGEGVADIVDALLTDDLRVAQPALRRHDIAIGTDARDQVIALPAFGVNVLLVGSSRSGKSTLLAGLLERLAARNRQVCVIDPEGDYAEFSDAIIIGGGGDAPSLDDIAQTLRAPDPSVVVNLLAVPLAQRPAFFAEVQRQIGELRRRFGRPHWLALDEAHHLLPIWGVADLPSLAPDLSEFMLVTVEPEHVVPEVLQRMDIVIATGTRADAAIAGFCRAIGQAPPELEALDLDVGEALVWFRREPGAPIRVRAIPPRVLPRRHRRKYAAGVIDPAHRFFFRPPGDGPVRVAANLIQFAELAADVDDATWLHHLVRGDFGRWFRDVIHDEALAAEADRGSALARAAIDESRALIIRAIEACCTLPS